MNTEIDTYKEYLSKEQVRLRYEQEQVQAIEHLPDAKGDLANAQRIFAKSGKNTLLKRYENAKSLVDELEKTIARGSFDEWWNKNVGENRTNLLEIYESVPTTD
jgi:CHASE3 domain sensor protein